MKPYLGPIKIFLCHHLYKKGVHSPGFSRVDTLGDLIDANYIVHSTRFSWHHANWISVFSYFNQSANHSICVMNTNTNIVGPGYFYCFFCEWMSNLSEANSSWYFLKVMLRLLSTAALSAPNSIMCGEVVMVLVAPGDSFRPIAAPSRYGYSFYINTPVCFAVAF